MTLATNTKIGIARKLGRLARGWQTLCGHDPSRIEARRRGIEWVLDLNEGIDLAIYVMGAFEPETIRAYRRLLRPGGVAVDIGANMGAHTLHLARSVSEGGRVIAFEPAAAAYVRLCRNLDANPALRSPVTALQVMLSKDDRSTPQPEIYASWPLGQSANAHPDHSGVAVSTEGAVAMSLDTALHDNVVARVDLIKIDVDGFEMEVLDGATNTLEAARPAIVMELAPYTLEERGEAPDAPADMLARLGYEFSDLSGRPIADIRARIAGLPKGHSVNVVAKSRSAT